MEEKKFKNLSTQYRNYLDQVGKVLTNYDIHKNYSFTEINIFYNTINDINSKLLIVEKDIEHLFKNYDKTNITISKLQNLLMKRNKIIIKNLLMSDLYKNYISKLGNEHKKNTLTIEKVLIRIIEKYSMSWKCCWSFVDIDDKGNVKKIELFDINDIKYFKEELNLR